MLSKNTKNIIGALITSIALFAPAAAFSAVAVIVHPSNGNTLTESDITRIFLGKKKSFPDGADAIPVDQKEGSAARSAFVGTVLKKNDQQIKAYWAQLLFTGKGTPPKEVGAGSDVKKLVSENPALIGYIDAAEADGSVKIVHQF
ncbi:MAG: phosphate ABC transporter substrate-binding protein [Cellvibrionaceae bacterium]